MKGHVPISVVYRVDDSGTSYILTNYLASACPLLDPKGAYGYKKVFTGVGIGGATAPNLPSSKFTQLIANIRAVKGLDLGDPDNTLRTISTFSSHHWIGALEAPMRRSRSEPTRVTPGASDISAPISRNPMQRRSPSCRRPRRRRVLRRTLSASIQERICGTMGSTTRAKRDPSDRRRTSLRRAPTRFSEPSSS